MSKYQTYLDSQGWKDKRRATLARVKSKSRRAAFRCEKCNEFFHAEAMQVHHKTYDRIGDELGTDLEVLCRWCHAERHGNDGPALDKQDKEVYRILFVGDGSKVSDGELNQRRNAVLDALEGLGSG